MDDCLEDASLLGCYFVVKGKELLTCEKIVVALFSGSSRIQNFSNGHGGRNIPEDMNVQQYRRHDVKSCSNCYSATQYNHGSNRR